MQTVSDIQHAAGLAYRAAGGPAKRVALLLHGYPESSYMWRAVLPALGGAGWRAIAPDLPGYGDSEPDPPATWERHILALERFLAALDVQRLALITHDWGALIGLRWACEHPDSITALVISNNGGFFTERGHHELARAMRTPGKGEQLIRSYTREGFGEALRGWSPGISQDALEEYWKAFTDDTRRLGQLDLYRSADFSKLAPYAGCLSRLGVPALILWGGTDPTAEVSVAERFHAELPGSELSVIDEAGHFVWEDAPDASRHALTEFLARAAWPEHVR
jgi:haloalkane dehalogenase